MITTISIIILVAMAVAIVWQLAVGLRPMWITGNVRKGETKPAEGEPASRDEEESEPASRDEAEGETGNGVDARSDAPAQEKAGRSLTLVVFASCDEEVLDGWISRVLEQDYPAFDVVVVYDANAENTASLAERYADEKRIYFTFIPPGSHTLNRRKLALTIGIKAAKGDYILTTIPQVRIPSDRWISEMMEPVNVEGDAKEVVLGFSHFDFSRIPASGRPGAKTETVTLGARWVGDALRQRPWRGDGNNLIFKRSLFFENKGFADGLLLEGGDDDIFVNRIARPDNTAVAVSPDTVLTVDWGEATGRVWKMSRKRYRSTRDLMPKGPGTVRMICRYLSWAMPLAAAGAAAASGFGWLADSIAGLLLILFYVFELILYRRAARRLLPGV